MLAEGLAERVVMVELDEDVVSVWQVIFSDAAPALAERITAFELTASTVDAASAAPPNTTLDRAFQTILKNRVNRSGILAAGAGRLKVGENGRGLLSRWYPETLARRIMALFPHRERVKVIHGDGLAVLEQHLDLPRTVSLLDPPYTAGGQRAGSRLYQHWDIEHDRLFALCSQLDGPFLMTYDDSPEVSALAQCYELAQRRLAMKNAHHVHLTELVLARDLSWL